MNYDCNHFGPHRSDFCAQLSCSISAFDKNLVFLRVSPKFAPKQLFWNTSFQSVLRQNHFYWLATNKLYWFCRCLRLKDGDTLAKGRIGGQFLKTVRNMTAFWDFSATWFFSVAPQFVQVLSVLFSSGCSWLSSCCCSHCLGLVCDWCVWDSDIAKKDFTFEFVLFWAFLCPSEAKMSFANSQLLFFDDIWTNWSQLELFVAFRSFPTTYDFLFLNIVNFESILDYFRIFSIFFDYSRLFSNTLDYSRLLSITLDYSLDCSRLLSITLAYSRLLSLALSIALDHFWCFLHYSMVSWLFFDYGAFVFQSCSTSFEERHLRGNPGFQTLLWEPPKCRNHIHWVCLASQVNIWQLFWSFSATVCVFFSAIHGDPAQLLQMKWWTSRWRHLPLHGKSILIGFSLF